MSPAIAFGLATLGRIAKDCGYFAARNCLDLARLADAREEQSAVAAHLRNAPGSFTDLRVPQWVERTDQLAQEFGVTLVNRPAGWAR